MNKFIKVHNKYGDEYYVSVNHIIYYCEELINYFDEYHKIREKKQGSRVRFRDGYEITTIETLDVIHNLIWEATKDE